MNSLTNSKPKMISKWLGKPESATILIFLIMLVVVATMQSNFFEASALRNSMNSFAPLILMAMGQAIVLIAGGLDLSSGTSMALMLCVLTRVMKKDDPITGVWALLITVGVMFGIGLVNGVSVGYLKLPPIIATFATSYIWLGIALFYYAYAGRRECELDAAHFMILIWWTRCRPGLKVLEVWCQPPFY